MQTKLKKYIKIQEGCTKDCSFCSNKKEPKSVEHYQILEQLKNFGKNNLLLQLLGDNICDYYSNNYNLINLLEMIIKTETSEIELEQIDPSSSITSQLLDFIKTEDKMIKMVNIPIQSANNNTLKRMNLKYSVEDVDNLLCAELDFGFNIIVGYPGETEEEFEETFKNLKRWKSEFKHLYFLPFGYCNLPGLYQYDKSMYNSIDIIEKRMNKIYSINSFEPRICVVIPKRKLNIIRFDSYKSGGF